MKENKKYWFVLHNREDYEAVPYMVGLNEKDFQKSPSAKTFFEQVHKGDKIILYIIREKVVVGIFEATSGKLIRDVLKWGKGKHYCCKIKELWKPVSSVEFELKKYFKFLQFTAEDIASKKYDQIVSEIKNENKRINKPLKKLCIGKPKNHDGVIALFAKIHRNLGYRYIEKLRTPFPDCTVIDNKGKKITIEFERKSSMFNHPPKGCDVLVCWENDLEEKDLEKKFKGKLIELKKKLSGSKSLKSKK